MNDPDISVVVPVYNSASTLDRLIARTNSALAGRLFDIWLVDDGSRDHSAQEITRLCEVHKHVRGVVLFRNFGQASALMAGLAQATGRIIIIMDDDLQNPPEDIPLLIAKLANGYDYVFGHAAGCTHENIFRKSGSLVNFWLTEKILQKPKNLIPSSFLAMRAEIAREILRYDGPYPYIAGMLFRISDRGASVPVKRLQRQEGQSGYSWKALVRLWLNGLTTFSIVPLRMAILAGSFSALSGLAWMGFIIARKLMDPRISMGWTSTVSFILFFSGIQLLAMGVLGEYLGRMFMSVNHTPQYAIRQVLGGPRK